MQKGFIGPIGDDLPSIVAILLAMTLFFSAVTYSFQSYNQKINNMDILKGSIDIARTLMSEGIVKSLDSPNADYVARSHALFYNACLDGDRSNCVGNAPNGVCPEDSSKFSYLIAKDDDGQVNLHKLLLCTWKG